MLIIAGHYTFQLIEGTGYSGIFILRALTYFYQVIQYHFLNGLDFLPWQEVPCLAEVAVIKGRDAKLGKD